MKITVLILSGAQGAVLVLEISDFRHMPWVLTCFIILIDYTANKINLCFILLLSCSSALLQRSRALDHPYPKITLELKLYQAVTSFYR